jgi:hypothetical protein
VTVNEEVRKEQIDSDIDSGAGARRGIADDTEAGAGRVDR